MGKRASREPQGLRSVKGGMGLCAELLLLSRITNVKDWIATGHLLLYYLRLWSCAQGGPLSCVLSDR